MHGEGRNPGTGDLLAVAAAAKFDASKAASIAAEIQEIVREDLREWLK